MDPTYVAIRARRCAQLNARLADVWHHRLDHGPRDGGQLAQGQVLVALQTDCLETPFAKRLSFDVALSGLRKALQTDIEFRAEYKTTTFRPMADLLSLSDACHASQTKH